MISLKITFALLVCALIVWIVTNLPPRIAELIYDIGSFLFGILGVLFLIGFFALFLYSRFIF
jgi:hypothetical protein